MGSVIEPVPAGSSLGLRLAFVGLWLTPGLSAAGDPVSLQLKWHHQFQFAGYYAAQAQDYYGAEGLEVR